MTMTANPPTKSVIDWRLNNPEIISINSLSIHYTSLRDIIPAMFLQCDSSAPNFSSSSSDASGSPRARMKNHLVEQAARAYLQPLNVDYNKSTQFFPWNWQKLMGYTPLLSFSIDLPPCSNGNSSSSRCSSEGCISGLFSGLKVSFSGMLKYMLGRRQPPQARFLQHGIC